MKASDSEVLDLGALGKLQGKSCASCHTPFIVGGEVRARFDAPQERWVARLRCLVCGSDWTHLARILTALDGRRGPRRLREVRAPRVWADDGP